MCVILFVVVFDFVAFSDFKFVCVESVEICCVNVGVCDVCVCVAFEMICYLGSIPIVDAGHCAASSCDNLLATFWPRLFDLFESLKKLAYLLTCSIHPYKNIIYTYVFTVPEKKQLALQRSAASSHHFLKLPP